MTFCYFSSSLFILFFFVLCLQFLTLYCLFMCSPRCLFVIIYFFEQIHRFPHHYTPSLCPLFEIVTILFAVLSSVVAREHSPMRRVTANSLFIFSMCTRCQWCTHNSKTRYNEIFSSHAPYCCSVAEKLLAYRLVIAGMHNSLYCC